MMRWSVGEHRLDCAFFSSGGRACDCYEEPEEEPVKVLPPETQGSRTLEEMCDYAAERQRTDPTIIPRFEVMGSEMERVAAYMATKHPTVKYQYSAIVFSEEQRANLHERVAKIRGED